MPNPSTVVKVAMTSFASSFSVSSQLIRIQYTLCSWHIFFQQLCCSCVTSNLSFSTGDFSFIRYITKEQVPDEIDFFSVDVSFISLCLVLPAARPLLKNGGEAVCLIKPQFEAGRENVGKKGVVRDRNVHIQVIKKIYDFCLENGFSVLDMDYSPIKGPEGNIEYLIYIRKTEQPRAEKIIDINDIVARSHGELDK